MPKYWEDLTTWPEARLRAELGVKDDLIAHMDNCLIAITDGKPLVDDDLDKLPPWRAVLLARAAAKAGQLINLDYLVAAAQLMGGDAGPGWLSYARDRFGTPKFEDGGPSPYPNNPAGYTG